ncbi:MAG: heavy metal translocating P-type ATPase [Chlamydiae bacterium]|nr:MAG: heavy metal translocating P-type ATPase [Chlamydiota bacterium]
MPNSPYLFDEFFASGKEESISPFLTASSRKWGKHLSLKTAFISGMLLFCSFIFSFFNPALSNLCLLFVYFFSGTPALIGALEDIKNLEINIDVLMTLAALLSVLIGSGMEGALLLVLFELSGAMEILVTEKTKSALVSLHQITPRFAYVVAEDGTIYEKSVKDIPLKTLLLIKAGEIVPLDSIVIKGSSFVNLSHLTGESRPVSKRLGDEVQAGAYNLDGTITVEVTRTSSDSTLNRIIELITQAQEAKPRLQRFLDRFGKWYAMSIISLFIIFAITLPWIFSIPYLGDEGGIYRALSFLIAASPCALIIATPTAYLSAISSCARKGILLKGGVILDALTLCHAVAFDKTGTLTTGNLHCTKLEILHPKQAPYSLEEGLQAAYGLEISAVHPIADAIISYAKEKQINPLEILDFTSTPGSGLQGFVLLQNRKIPVYIGNLAFVLSYLPKTFSSEIFQKGTLNSYLLLENTLFLFHFTDTLRTQSKPLITRLKNQNLHPIMLTGDKLEIAKDVAEQTGISTIYADLKPEDKLAKVAELSTSQGLIMVGDGINDAPALARATVGISMGTIGSATAIEASDIVFLNDDLSLLDWMIQKAHGTIAIVKQNIVLALAVILLVTLPALLGLVPLWLAVIFHEGGTVLVGLNSLRLLRQ